MTPQGVASLVSGVLALVLGRVFGVLELFVIGAGFIVAPVLALLYVGVRRPRATAARWIHPRTLIAGDTGRVDIDVEHRGRIRSAPFELAETVRRMNSPEQVARLEVPALKPGVHTSAGYNVPTSRRGLVELGPLAAVVRDPLGLARRRLGVAGLDVVVVAPKSILLEMPKLGHGVLGRELMNQARRMGPGDFHSLREYAEGDEPRTIYWRASARSENLMVKQHTVEGVRRCTVVLDTDVNSYADAESFERAVVATASLTHSGDAAGLTTRCLVGSGADLRGPEVVPHALRVLAEVQPGAPAAPELDRDPGDGLGLLILVSGSRSGSGWQVIQTLVDPSLTVLSVSTDVAGHTTFDLPARTEEELRSGWARLVGRGRVDLTPEVETA